MQSTAVQSKIDHESICRFIEKTDEIDTKKVGIILIMNYYKKVQYIAEVNEQDTVIGKIEKWEAHKKGILHRGYTAILTYEDNYILQYRRHPAFDNVLDLSFSSHQLYDGKEMQSSEEAILNGLRREWDIKESDIKKSPVFIAKFQYKAFDDVSGYYEHEIDHVYKVALNRMPQPNNDFAYGFMVLHKNNLDLLKEVKMYVLLAPWVQKIALENA